MTTHTILFYNSFIVLKAILIVAATCFVIAVVATAIANMLGTDDPVAKSLLELRRDIGIAGFAIIVVLSIAGLLGYRRR
ncbi:hypothetical protein ACFLV5_01200 [Chloroflexota bacterium]